jgi:uncharacterized protein (TIGR03083 family)
MDSETIWKHIDGQRTALADFLDTLTPAQWSSPSLCKGWSVRDVAAHLTHSHLGLRTVARAAVASGFRFDAMMNRLVLSDNRTPDQITASLRAMVGSRRRPPTPTPMDPLMDVLVHGQDIAIALGADRPMPIEAAVAVGHHLWRMRFPLNPRRALPGVQLIAEDADFVVGDGRAVQAPIRELVLLLSGRRALADLSPGADPA